MGTDLPGCVKTVPAIQNLSRLPAKAETQGISG